MSIRLSYIYTLHEYCDLSNAIVWFLVMDTRGWFFRRALGYPSVEHQIFNLASDPTNSCFHDLHHIVPFFRGDSDFHPGDNHEELGDCDEENFQFFIDLCARMKTGNLWGHRFHSNCKRLCLTRPCLFCALRVTVSQVKCI